MSRPLVSICLASYQRRHLLERSLLCYENQEFPKDDVEIVVIDDHSTDGTSELVREWSQRTGIRAVSVVPSPKKEGWRDCGAVLNYGIRAAAGEYILLTHPEVMPGKQSVSKCVDALSDFEDARKHRTGCAEGGPLGLYACCRIYYLSPREQDLIDTVPWDMESPLAVRRIEGFYELDVNGAPDFSHRATDIVAQPGSRIPRWESWVFGGCSRETWKRMGGMLETVRWGAVDIAFTHRRRTLGIGNHTCPEESTICVHQSHDDPTKNVVTDRDMSKWVEELRNVNLDDPRKMRYPAVDHLGWG